MGSTAGQALALYSGFLIHQPFRLEAIFFFSELCRFSINKKQRASNVLNNKEAAGESLGFSVDVQTGKDTWSFLCRYCQWQLQSGKRWVIGNVLYASHFWAVSLVLEFGDTLHVHIDWNDMSLLNQGMFSLCCSPHV